MNTAISLPDETFERASHRAESLGISRSEFFARAAEHYLDKLDSLEEPDSSTTDAVGAGHRTLQSTKDDW